MLAGAVVFVVLFDERIISAKVFVLMLHISRLKLWGEALALCGIIRISR